MKDAVASARDVRAALSCYRRASYFTPGGLRRCVDTNAPTESKGVLESCTPSGGRRDMLIAGTQETGTGSWLFENQKNVSLL